jgi:hypothetical protein
MLLARKTATFSFSSFPGNLFQGIWIFWVDLYYSVSLDLLGGAVVVLSRKKRLIIKIYFKVYGSFGLICTIVYPWIC